MYVWVVRRRNEEVAPPSYLEVTKPPSYSACQSFGRGQESECRHRFDSILLADVARDESTTSLTETEPPAYSDLYNRDMSENSQLDRLVVIVITFVCVLGILQT